MRKSPEASILRSLDHTLSPEELGFFKHVLEISKQTIPKPENFLSVYPPEDIQKDVARVERRNNDFESNTETELYGATLEVLIQKLGPAWIGGSWSHTSEFDDYTKGIDLVVEIRAIDGTRVFLGIDATSSEEQVENKLNEVEQQTTQGIFPALKYFQSKKDIAIRGTVELPRIIVGDIREHIVELAGLYKKYVSAKDAETKNRLKSLLVNHPFGKELTAQILIQLALIKSDMPHLAQSDPENLAYKKKIRILENLETHFERKKAGPLVRAPGQEQENAYSNPISSAIGAWRRAV